MITNEWLEDYKLKAESILELDIDVARKNLAKIILTLLNEIQANRAETLVKPLLADVEELTKTYNDSLDRLKKEYELKMKTLCRKQKEICANSAKAYIDKNGNAVVKNTSILNAESAWKDDSKQSV